MKGVICCSSIEQRGFFRKNGDLTWVSVVDTFGDGCAKCRAGGEAERSRVGHSISKDAIVKRWLPLPGRGRLSMKCSSGD